MIKKQEFIDLAIIAITGGKPTSASSVWYADLEAYLPYAINFAILGQYYANIKNEDGSSRDVPGSFISTIDNLTIDYDAVRKCGKITLPYQPIPLPRNQGIRFVGYNSGEPFVGGAENTKVLSKYTRKHASNMPRIEFEGLLIYVYGSLQRGQKAMVKMISPVGELAGVDYLPIPGGMESQVMDILVQFGKGERFLPKNDIQNGTDMVQQFNTPKQ
jgi:hypothetical protein